MSDIVSDVPRKIVTKHEGKDYTLRRLSIYDRAEILRKDRKIRRDQMKAELKDFGVSPVDAIATLGDFDREEISFEHWVEFVNNQCNQSTILMECLSGHGLPDDQIIAIAKATDVKWTDLVELCGLQVTTESIPDAENTDPNVLPPLSYSSPTANETSTPKSS